MIMADGTLGSSYTSDGRSRGAWLFFSLFIAFLVMLPIAAIAVKLFEPPTEVWRHLARTFLATYIANSLILLTGVALCTAVIGTGCAWLVANYRFPGRRVFEIGLLLPMALPAYVLAYVYTDLLDYGGPVQRLIRTLGGYTGAGDYVFPEIRSMGGAILMLSLALYPYVYLMARAAFINQSVTTLEASRVLGLGPFGAFWRIALPMARPALIAGLSLAMMETLADFGTVDYFAVRTFTTAIYTTWFSRGDPQAAVQLAAFLLGFVALLLFLEQHSRRRQRYYESSRQHRPAQRRDLGWRGWPAAFACLLPVLLGFLLPVAELLRLSLRHGDKAFGSWYGSLAANSFRVSIIAALLTVAVAVLMAYGQRLSRSPLIAAANRAASLGYAIPGSVIAVGVFIPVAAFDNAVDAFMRSSFGISTGLLISGGIGVLLFAYLVRFLAVSYGAISAGLAKITPSMDAAARTLGCPPRSVLIRIHLPLLRPSLLAAALIVFVDVMKELPATLILRPFNFETLAVRVYNLASDERLAEASTAALTIVAVGIIPIVLLSRAMDKNSGS